MSERSVPVFFTVKSDFVLIISLKVTDIRKSQVGNMFKIGPSILVHPLMAQNDFLIAFRQL